MRLDELDEEDFLLLLESFESLLWLFNFKPASYEVPEGSRSIDDPPLGLFFFILATIRSTDDENMEDLRSQVDFLNSVIVDMQRKNDELKAKMELLESAGILETIGKAFFSSF